MPDTTSTVTPAGQRAPYGRRRSHVLGALPTEEPVQTYYGLPALKASHYRWLVATYFFVGGLAGAAQLLAQVADLVGGRAGRPTTRWGRYLALVGAMLSPAFLIKDLHTPSRWYNMLRIFRPTSPMSIGSWTLSAFGSLSGLAAAAQLLEDLGLRGPGRVLGRAFGLPAAFSGMLMAVYTGSLLTATSTPLWAVAYRYLPPLFGATAAASASAALSLLLERAGAPVRALRGLEGVGLVASSAQLAISLAADREWKRRGVAGPLEAPPLAAADRLLVLGFGVAVPLLVHGWHVLTGRRSAGLARLAALATLVGAYAERAVIIFAGKTSATRPEDYFRLAQRD